MVGRGAVGERGVVGQALAEVGLEDRDAVVQERVVQTLPPRPSLRVGQVDQRPVSAVGGRGAAQVRRLAGGGPDQVAALCSASS